MEPLLLHHLTGNNPDHLQVARPTSANVAPTNPKRSACTSRCLTEEGCQRVPPRGVRSRIDSSCTAICCSVRSGAAVDLPLAFQFVPLDFSGPATFLTI
jgi:hypothetical protein